MQGSVLNLFQSYLQNEFTVSLSLLKRTVGKAERLATLLEHCGEYSAHRQLQEHLASLLPERASHRSTSNPSQEEGPSDLTQNAVIIKQEEVDTFILGGEHCEEPSVSEMCKNAFLKMEGEAESFEVRGKADNEFQTVTGAHSDMRSFHLVSHAVSQTKAQTVSEAKVDFVSWERWNSDFENKDQPTSGKKSHTCPIAHTVSGADVDFVSGEKLNSVSENKDCPVPGKKSITVTKAHTVSGANVDFVSGEKLNSVSENKNHPVPGKKSITGTNAQTVSGTKVDFQMRYNASGTSRTQSEKGAFQNHTSEKYPIRIRKKNMYHCFECGKSICDRSNFYRHTRIHTGVKPFVCSECGHSFRHSSALKRHTRIHHTKEKPYHCSVCGKNFHQSSSLKSHSKIHTREKPYKCLVCDESFTWPVQLIKHAKTHGETPLNCWVCGKCFVDPIQFRRHLRIHSGKPDKVKNHRIKNIKKKLFQCLHCGESFRSRRRLKEHLPICEETISLPAILRTIL